MIDPLVCIGCFLLLAGFALDIVSVATKEWVVFKNGFTYGLWTQCISTGVCSSLSAEEMLDGVRATTVISIIVSGIAVMVVLVSMTNVCFKRGTNSWINPLIIALALVAAVLSLIGILLFNGNIWDDSTGNSDLGYSFWLSVAAIVLFTVAALVVLAAIICSPRNRQLREQGNAKSQKGYPFNIPYYDYKQGEEQKNGNQIKTSEGTREKEEGKSTAHPFQSNYRYIATNPLSLGVYSNGDTSVFGMNSPASRYSGSQIPVNQSVDTRSNQMDNQSYNYTTSDILSRSGYTRYSHLGNSERPTQSAYGMSTASPRMQRDVLGYPLNYNRHL